MTQSTQSIIRWRDVLALFEQVIDCAEPERDALLRRIAHEQSALYPHVLTLLAADRSAEMARFIAAAPPVSETVAEDHDSLLGQSIGAYRVLRHIGSGGMGQVWLAERADGRYAGQVAIKLLRSFSDALIAKRFEREGQLLARLQHPNIARLLDAGSLPNGQLYLVLEYVEGDRIDRALDEKRATIDERIRAFLPVCDAVSHAHTQLVVHRDLKPSNVMLTADGTVKLLDFGIAKLLADQGEIDATELTQVVGRAFTPEFAAPEQTRGDAIGTQADVYALGAILFRLLSGASPGDARTPGAADSQARRLQMEHDAAADAAMMSQVLARVARRGETDSLGEAASRRGTTIERLRATLAGDLDLIVAKALRFDQSERYRSVTELRDDLARYLRSEPISVRPDSLGYRAKKFVYRHKIGVFATAAFSGALIAGVVGTLWQASIARERSLIAEQNAARALVFEDQAKLEADRAIRGERDARSQAARAEAAQIEAQQAANIAQLNESNARAQTARAERYRALAEVEARNAKAQASRAERENAKATSVKNFLVELFNTGNVNVPDAEARELKVATTRLLNRGTERLKTQLIDQPEVRSELIDTVANLHLSIESPEQAEALYREQLAMIESRGQSESSEAAATWMKIGRALRNQRQYDQAEAAQLRALAIMDRLGEHASETRGRALLELVQMSFWTNTAVAQRAVLLPRARESIAILERIPRAASLGEAWFGLGRLHEAAGENAEAATAYERGIKATIASEGSERHAVVAGGRQMRARVLGFRGEFDEAERELLAAQRIFEDTVGAEHRFSVDVRAELAEVFHQRGRSAEAIALFRRALVEQSQLRGISHNSTDRTRRLLAEALYDIGEYREALALAREALLLTQQKANPSKVFEARVQSLIGRASVQVGALETARAALDAANAIWQTFPERYGRGVTALDRAMLSAAEGRTAAQRADVELALALLHDTQGKTRNDYWRARLASAALAPDAERIEVTSRVFRDFEREPSAAHFPRARAAILAALTEAQTLARRAAD